MAILHFYTFTLLHFYSFPTKLAALWGAPDFTLANAERVPRRTKVALLLDPGRIVCYTYGIGSGYEPGGVFRVYPPGSPDLLRKQARRRLALSKPIRESIEKHIGTDVAVVFYDHCESTDCEVNGPIKCRAVGTLAAVSHTPDCLILQAWSPVGDAGREDGNYTSFVILTSTIVEFTPLEPIPEPNYKSREQSLFDPNLYPEVVRELDGTT